MLIFQYGSWIHILTLLFAAGLVCGLYFLLKKRSLAAKMRLLYILAAVNVAQHLLKFLVWPHAWGTGFCHTNTAYNVCAILILMTPFLLRKREGAWRETVSYVGSAGCMLAFLIPYWFVGQSIWNFYVGWEYVRFLFCHLLLLCTSLLPILWGLVHIRKKNFWKIGLCFFTLLAVILVNDVLCICMGLTDGSAETMYETLYSLNPLWMMHPPEGFESYSKLLSFFSPDIFLGRLSGFYTPILWYFVPLYSVITLLAYPLGALAERYLPNVALSPAEKLLSDRERPHSFL